MTEPAPALDKEPASVALNLGIHVDQAPAGTDQVQTPTALNTDMNDQALIGPEQPTPDCSDSNDQSCDRDDSSGT